MSIYIVNNRIYIKRPSKHVLYASINYSATTGSGYSYYEVHVVQGGSTYLASDNEMQDVLAGKFVATVSPAACNSGEYLELYGKHYAAASNSCTSNTKTYLQVEEILTW